MKKLLILAILLVGTILYAQNIHEVQAKETPYSIAKKYNLSIQELYRLNPILEGSKLSLGQKIKVKNTLSNVKSNVDTSVKVNTRLSKITVQPKQTLYGITRQYHISEKELISLNPHISTGMKIGDELQIPLDLVKKYAISSSIENLSTPASKSLNADISSVKKSIETPKTESTYEVQAKDTYYGIGRKFEISKEKLLELNPGLEEKGLQPGEIIVISGSAKKVMQSDKNSIIETSKKEETKAQITSILSGKDNEYIVQDGDTVFTILNKFNLTWDELLELNPRLSAGLQTGMKLKVSKSKSTSTYKKNNSSALNISLLLPLSLDKSNYQFKQMSMDFLKGAKLAASRYVASGKALKIKIVDVGESPNIDSILKLNNINESDVIIGPFFKSNLISVLNEVQDRQIPVVSPFANSSDLYSYSNLIISETNKKVYAKRIAKEVILSYSDEIVYILTDDKNTDIAETIVNDLNNTKKNFKTKLINSMSEVDLEKNMMTGQYAPTSVILCSDDIDLGKDFTKNVISLSQKSKGMKSFSVFYHNVFEKEEQALSNTKLVYLMDRKINTEGNSEKEILKAYKNEYCNSPSKYAIIGYDVVADILQRENDKAELFNNLEKTQTQLATKFEYIKSNEGAYLNMGYRVIRLNP